MDREQLRERAVAAKWRAVQVGRRLRIVPYRTERWALHEWQDAYSSGRFDYFASLEELPRYSILLGYLATFAEGRAILDVGCGGGLLRRRLGGIDFARYCGIDLSEVAIAAAAALEDGSTRFVCGDVVETELDPVDLIVLNEVLYFAKDAPAMLDRLDQLLRPGGLVLTSMWRHPGDMALWRLLDRRYDLVDATHIRNEGNAIAPRGWRVTCHRVRQGS